VKTRGAVALGCVLPLIAGGLLLAQTQDSDPLLRAMKDELERSRKLSLAGLDAPYFFEYRVEDTNSFNAAATLGALLSTDSRRSRLPMVRVRVGDYTFDNSNHIFSDASSGSRYDSGSLPIEDDYLAFRHAFWLATDRTYKAAEDAIARKRSSLKNISLPEQVPDFSKAPAVQAILPMKRDPLPAAAWSDRVVKLSAIFRDYPQVLSSSVDLEVSESTNYLVNSEGTVERTPEDLAYIRVRASGLAPDGVAVRDADSIQAFHAGDLPSEADLGRRVTEVAKDVAALTQAPVGEAYDGPMLFEARAAAQLFGQLLGDNLKVTRKPVADAGRSAPHVASEFENRVGSRVLPEFLTVIDDATLTQWHGETLLGHYEYDLEGVAPKPLTLIDKGVLRTYLLTRTPAFKGFDSSNGHARMTGSFGARGAGFGNLTIQSSETEPSSELKKKLIEMCQQRNKPYGILIRKLDYPSSASIEELRRLAAGASQSGGGHLVVLPLLVYKVYPDGREELVRGVQFRGVSTKSLKDIVATSQETYVLNMIDSNAPFALMGAGSYVASASVVAPAVLFDELEIEPIQEDVPKPPIVPPPALTSSAGNSLVASAAVR